MKQNKTENAPAQPSRSVRNQRGGFGWLILLLLLSMLMLFWVGPPPTSRIDYSFFLKQLDRNNIKQLTIYPSSAEGVFKVPPERPVEYDAFGKIAEPKKSANGTIEKLAERFQVALPSEGEVRRELFARLDRERTQKPANDEGVSDPAVDSLIYDVVPSTNWNPLFTLLGIASFLLLGAGLFMLLRRSRDNMMGGGFLNSFTRSTAKRFEPSDQKVTFEDVAGLDGVKADLKEIVEFLRAPEKFQKLGGRVPKGVLLNGPPGTGKTLLARAIAGEAGVAFFSVNGSEFIQMFVGVGASRVRDLFETAKQNSPAIVFIDEIDAVGRQRGAGLGGGHDEREQTLNQILSEMDGFSPTESVIVVASTNRPDVLDPALLRPGRFDRHITVGRPSLKGREEILKVHVRDVPLDADVDLRRLAQATVGLTGADLRNIVNEAALWAARYDKTRVFMADFERSEEHTLNSSHEWISRMPSSA
mgnify:CR=1 FL=1